MRRIAIINQADAVGKTTITTNLGHALALQGHRVTVIDLDPKGCLTKSLGYFRAPSRGLDKVLLNGIDVECVLVNARDFLTLLPSGADLHRIEHVTQGGAARARLLDNALKGKLRDQEFIIFDCPASGLLSVNAIFSVNELLIPVTGDARSMRCLMKTIGLLKKFAPFLERPTFVWIGLSRYLPRRRLSKKVMEIIRTHFTNKLMVTPIKEAAVLAECQGAGRTIFEYRGMSRSAREFEGLAEDLIEQRTM